MLVGLQVNAIALVLAAIATHRAGALWTILAYPAFLIASCGFFIVRRLTGMSDVVLATLSDGRGPLSSARVLTRACQPGCDRARRKSCPAMPPER